MRLPFAAARARNEGFEALRAANPDLEFVQFIDGDCELESGWIETAERFLNEESDFAATCGRRRERFPEARFYNRLCAEEWTTPDGAAAQCGGDAMLRCASFRADDGYDHGIITGTADRTRVV